MQTSGPYHAVALRSDGTVWAKGRNDTGQLGDGTSESWDDWVQVVGLSDVTAVAAGEHHSLALRKDGTVWAWGRNFDGQLGLGEEAAGWVTLRGSGATAVRGPAHRNVPVQVPGLPTIVSIAAGGLSSLAVAADGTVWQWGALHEVKLSGVVSTRDPLTGRKAYNPMTMPALAGMVKFAVGREHVIGIDAGGKAWAWGRNIYGELGTGVQTADGKPASTNAPVPVQIQGRVVRAEAYGWGGQEKYSRFYTDDGGVWLAGANVGGVVPAAPRPGGPHPPPERLEVPVQINAKPVAIDGCASGADPFLTIWVGRQLARQGRGANYIDMGAVPVILNGSTFVPLRFLSEALGVPIGWDSVERRITLRAAAAPVELWIGRTDARFGGVARQLTASPFLQNGRTMVPLRFISEAFGRPVLWSGVEEKVTVCP